MCPEAVLQINFNEKPYPKSVSMMVPLALNKRKSLETSFET